MANTKKDRKRMIIRNLVIMRLKEIGEAHIRDLTFFIDKNSVYTITPTGLAQMLRQSVSSGHIKRKDIGRNESVYIVGDNA